MVSGPVKNVDLLTSEGGTDLTSIGVGVHYSITPVLTFRIDYGWQLKSLTAAAARESCLHAGFVLSY